jgi:hypothetical protein
MRRLHLFEIAEQPWCPSAVRDGCVEYLQFMVDAGKVYAPIVPHLAEALRRSAVTQVVDLGAGAGGPWRSLLPALAAVGATPRVRLTDRYPDLQAFARIAQDTAGAVTGDPRPVDAAAVPADLSGLRTIFSALHHFRPDAVRAVLRDAVARRESVAVFEATRRDARAILLMGLTPLFVLLATPFVRPFRSSRLLWTYVLPAIPLVTIFDGVVSCLRVYTPDELRALTRDLGAGDAGDYTWEAGETGRGPVPITFLVGAPAARPNL